MCRGAYAVVVGSYLNQLVQSRIVGAVGPMKVRNIGTGRQGDVEFVHMGGILVILGDAFSDLCRGDADDGVGGGIVIRISAKDLDSEGSLFDAIDFSDRKSTRLNSSHLG